MKANSKMIKNALELREKGRITKAESLFFVPSSDGSKVYTVNGHHCECPATGLCKHLLATTYLDALLTIELCRYAESLGFLAAIVEMYSDRIEVLPAKIRQLVKDEYRQAKQRINGSIQDAYDTRVIKEGASTVMIVSKQEAARDYGAIAIS